MNPKLAFQVSQFSGPLSYGPFPMVSSLPPFRAPSPTVRQAPSAAPLTSVPNPVVASPQVKVANNPAVEDSAYVVPVEKLKALLAAKETLKKIAAQGYGTTITNITSPLAALRRTQAVGQGKISPAPGPSISAIARPVDVGKGSPTGPVLAGAGKNTLGV